MKVADKKVLVIGAAKSGIAASKFLASQGAQVIINDIKSNLELIEVEKELESFKNIETLWGRQPEITSIKPDFIVVSPGISLDIPPLKEASLRGIPIIGELELAFCFSHSPFVAITGTNGKTTTTTLIGQLFQDAGRNVLVGGNIGLPLISQVDRFDQKDIIVAEASSFQLETINLFKPKVAAILNITPDHLDRHKTLDEYIRCKGQIFKNQVAEDYLILNYDDKIVRKLAPQVESKVIYFSRKNKLETGVYLKEDEIYISIDNFIEKVCNKGDIYIKGNHNLENAMAAIAVGFIMGLDRKQIKSTLEIFPGVSHRLEYVTEINNVKYINDSKGTNPDASIKALESFQQPIVLIAGGKNKGSNFGEIAKIIKEKVKELVLVGEAAPEIREAMEEQNFTNYYLTSSFEEAVYKAHNLAIPGDIVLLSPACASWDMFNSYEERGDYFKELVFKLRR